MSDSLDINEPPETRSCQSANSWADHRHKACRIKSSSHVKLVGELAEADTFTGYEISPQALRAPVAQQSGPQGHQMERRRLGNDNTVRKLYQYCIVVTEIY
jgi:hypothetical protein